MALGPYLRRRWRIVGFFLVLIAGTALFSTLTDRGHEPLWSDEPGDEILLVAAAPDGSRFYALTAHRGVLRDLVAYAGDGEVAWRTRVPGNVTAAILEAGPDVVALATVASPGTTGARLLAFHGSNGTARLAADLPHSARALAVEPATIAVAVEFPPTFPVLLWRNGVADEPISVGEVVHSIDLEAGFLAIGTDAGRVAVVAPNGTRVLDAMRPYAAYQVRLAVGARAVASAGGAHTGGGGFVEWHTLGATTPALVWSSNVTSEVRYLDLSADGRRALALASAGGRSEVRLFDTAEGTRPVWTVRAGGVVHREGTSTASGARLSPDGALAVFGILTGPLTAYRTEDPEGDGPEPAWTHAAAGVRSIAFAAGKPDALVAAVTYAPGKGTDRLLVLDVDDEPFVRDLSRFLPAALTIEALFGLAVVGGGYVRRPR